MYVKTSVRKTKNGEVRYRDRQAARDLLTKLSIDPPRKIHELTLAT